MIPEIYDPAIKHRDKVVSFHLEKTNSGTGSPIALLAVDDQGDPWLILTIQSEGIYRHGNIGKDTGIPLDRCGRMKIN